MSRPDASRVSPALLVAGVAIAVLVAIPVVYLVLRAADGRGGLGAFFEPTVGWLALRSLVLAMTVGVIATLLALVFAVLVEAVDLPGRRIATALIVVPVAIPSYVAATAYVAGVSPLGVFGPLLAGIGIGPVFPEGFAWSVFVLVTSTVPLAFLPIRAALARVDGDVYDAARTLGCSRSRAIVTAVRPVLGRALRGGLAVVVLYSLAELGTVAILRYDALPRVIYHQFLSAFDRAAAARSALLLLALVLATLALTASRSAVTRGGPRGRRLRFQRGRRRWLAMLPIAAYVLVAAVVPLVSLASWLLRTRAPGTQLANALWGSIEAAVIVLGPALVAAVIISLVAQRGGRIGRAAGAVVASGFAMPGLVVALGLSVAALRLVPSLYQGWVPYTVAMMILFAPLGVVAIRGSLAAVPPVLEDAARTLGATPRQVWWRVTLPIVWPGVLAAAALIAISTMKELGASLLLLPTGTKTLAVQLWDAVEEARYGHAAAPALVLTALAAITAFAIERRGTRDVR